MKDHTLQKNGFGKCGLLAVAAALTLMLFTGGAYGAGLLIADGGFGGVLEVQEHAVRVVINNGIAVTHVTQVFKNTEKRQVEALYTFPVPKRASVANFSMWIDGKEMVGEVLEKKRAREIYNSYKQQRRDPGLLEQVDYKTFEMRIFPIGPEAEQRVQISYYQELDVDHDRATYVYPLATVTRGDIDTRTTGRFAIDFAVKSAVPITELESPSHGDAFVTARHSDGYVQASLEAQSGSLARDVVLSYGLSRPKTGIDMIASNGPEEDGYFYLTLTAGEDLAEMDRGMDYVFMLDVSGSMADDGKLLVSKDSLGAFINELGETDRFEVMTFNLQPVTLFNELRSGNDNFKAEADRFLAGQRGRGGTVISGAMHTAYRYSDPDRILNVVILSDGMTEQAERQKIIDLIRERPANTRVFCIGIGNEINRPLLEQLAQESGGLAAFVSRGDDFERQAKAFRRKLMRPAASDIEIDFAGLKIYDLEPEELPNLFHGAPVRLFGRYSGSGQAQVMVRGDVQGTRFEQSAALNFPENDPDNPEIERMWAWRRVDRLLKMADGSRSRDRAIDEIVNLGETYSIVTEYTSFLVLENDGEYQRWKIERRNGRRLQRDREAQARLEERLEAIRSKAVTDLGPQPVLEEKEKEPQHLASSRPNPAQGRPSAQPQNGGEPGRPQSQNQNRSFDFNFGSGPVGPLFVGIAWWLRRRKKG